MTRLSLLAPLLLLVPAVAHAEPVVAGVWRSGSQETDVLLNRTQGSFHNTVNARHKKGQRLMDLETYRLPNGQRRWAGLWGTGKDAARHSLSMTASQLASAATKNHKDKLRIVDLETYVEGGQRRWAAVWRAGTHRQYYEHAIDESNLKARLDARHADNLRVVDIETYVSGGKRKFAVVWSAGTYPNYVSAGLSASAFKKLATERHKQGLRLVDYERYKSGSKERFAGVWRKGNDANWYTFDRYPESFEEMDLYLQDKGRRLVDLEVYDDTCGNTYPLPFEDEGKWWISNGNYDDNGGHGGKSTGLQAYAWDFLNDTDGNGSSDEGAKILAVAPGVVVDLLKNETGNTKTEWKNFSWDSGDPPPSVGNFVVVDHRDGTYGTYWHLQANSVPVNVGDKVITGQVLGKMGNTGNSSTPHVHFDVRKDWEVGYPVPKFKEYHSVKVRMRDENHACWRPRESDTLKSSNTAKVPMKKLLKAKAVKKGKKGTMPASAKKKAVKKPKAVNPKTAKPKAVKKAPKGITKRGG